MDTFIVYERPKLNSPYLVLGISGWVDGGEASTGSVKYLINKLGAKRFGEISAREFHVFQVPGVTPTRPHITIEDGIVKKHRLPKNEFFIGLMRGQTTIWCFS